MLPHGDREDEEDCGLKISTRIKFPHRLYIQTRMLIESPPPGFEWDPKMNERCDERWFFSFFDVARIFSDDEYDFLELGRRRSSIPMDALRSDTWRSGCWNAAG